PSAGPSHDWAGLFDTGPPVVGAPPFRADPVEPPDPQASGKAAARTNAAASASRFDSIAIRPLDSGIAVDGSPQRGPRREQSPARSRHKSARQSRLRARNGSARPP